MKKILITGGLGFVGYHLTNKLKEDCEITIIDSLKSDFENYVDRYEESFLKELICNEGSILYNKIIVKNIDITNKNVLENLFKNNGFDVVIHLAAKSGVRGSNLDKISYLENNIIGFNNIIENCVKYKVKHLIFASSSCVYGDNPNQKECFNDLSPISFYGTTKMVNELMCETIINNIKTDLKITGLRFFNIYGEKSRKNMILNLFTHKLKDGETIKLFNEGKNKRDLIYVGDVVDLIEKIIESDKEYRYEIFNVGSGKNINNLEYLKTLVNILHVKHPQIELVEGNKEEIGETLANIEKVGVWFNWQPKTVFKEKLKEITQW